MNDFDTKTYCFKNPPQEFNWDFVKTSTDKFINNSIKKYLDNLRNIEGTYGNSPKQEFGQRLRKIIKTVYEKGKDMKTSCVDHGYTFACQDIVGMGWADKKTGRFR